MISCPACDVGILNPWDACPICMRRPQERAAWLIQKWRADGSFAEPPPQPTEEIVSEWRQRWPGKARSHGKRVLMSTDMPTAEESMAGLVALDDESSEEEQRLLWGVAAYQMDEAAGVESCMVSACFDETHGPGSKRWSEEHGRCGCQDRTNLLGKKLRSRQLDELQGQDDQRWNDHQDAYLRFPPRFEAIGDTTIDVNARARSSMMLQREKQKRSSPP